MTNEERLIRMKVAHEIMNDVFSDLCRTNNKQYSRDDIRNFCDFINESRNFINNFFDKKEW